MNNEHKKLFNIIINYNEHSKKYDLTVIVYYNLSCYDSYVNLFNFMYTGVHDTLNGFKCL